MGYYRYLLMLALAATTVFTSCSKDDDKDDDKESVSRESLVGSYEAIDSTRQYVFNGTDYDTVFVSSGIDYEFTIELPAASDGLGDDFVIVKNVANGKADASVPARLNNDVLEFDPNGTSSSEMTGTFEINGRAVSGTIIYIGDGGHRTGIIIDAIREN